MFAAVAAPACSCVIMLVGGGVVRVTDGWTLDLPGSWVNVLEVELRRTLASSVTPCVSDILTVQP